MPPQPSCTLLTPSQSALLAAIDAGPIAMGVDELTYAPRGRDLQVLGQLGLVRMMPARAGRDAAGFVFARTDAATPKGPPIE